MNVLATGRTNSHGERESDVLLDGVPRVARTDTLTHQLVDSLRPISRRFLALASSSVTAVHARCGGCVGVRARVALVVCMLLVSVVLSQLLDAARVQAFVRDMRSAGLVSAPMVVVMFAAAVVLLLPAMLISAGAGAAYGVVQGTAIAWTGTVAGQVAAFMLGRHLLRELVHAYALSHVPGWRSIDANIGRDGWKLVLLLRLSPVLPFGIASYALSVTSIGLLPYASASAIAALPYIALFAWLGAGANDLYQLIHTGTALQPEVLLLLATTMVLSAAGLLIVCRQVLTPGDAQPGDSSDGVRTMPSWPAARPPAAQAMV
jgi:uncharacterized membrane protein YdjX (TVP38/TMEM64 family)